jgi:hypothetical protein
MTENHDLYTPRLSSLPRLSTTHPLTPDMVRAEPRWVRELPSIPRWFLSYADDGFLHVLQIRQVMKGSRNQWEKELTEERDRSLARWRDLPRGQDRVEHRMVCMIEHLFKSKFPYKQGQDKAEDYRRFDVYGAIVVGREFARTGEYPK